MIALYVALLTFLAYANKLYSKSTPERALRSVIFTNKVANLISQWDTLEQRAYIEASNSGFILTSAHLSALSERYENKQLVEAIAWISNVPFEENHNTARQGRVDETGEWLLQHRSYLRWRRSRSSAILWLHGSPGCGKTKLITKVIDDMRDTLGKQRDDDVLAYFYCDLSKPDRRDPTTILRSFIRQMVMSSKNDARRNYLLKLYKTRQQEGFPSGELKLEDSQSILLDIVRSPTLFGRITLIVDGLDECVKDTREAFLDILDYLISISNTRAQNMSAQMNGQGKKSMKILVSSRPNRDIKRSLIHGLNLEVKADDNQDDIDKFIEEKITKNPPRKWPTHISPELIKTVKNKLMNESRGMFQWTALQVHQLGMLSREKDIRERLQY